MNATITTKQQLTQESKFLRRLALQLQQDAGACVPLLLANGYLAAGSSDNQAQQKKPLVRLVRVSGGLYLSLGAYGKRIESGRATA